MDKDPDKVPVVLSVVCALLAVAALVNNRIVASLREDCDRIASEMAVAKGKFAAFSRAKAEGPEAGDVRSDGLGEDDALDADWDASDIGNDKPGDGLSEGFAFVSNGCRRLWCESSVGHAVSPHGVAERGDGNRKGRRRVGVRDDF